MWKVSQKVDNFSILAGRPPLTIFCCGMYLFSDPRFISYHLGNTRMDYLPKENMAVKNSWLCVSLTLGHLLVLPPPWWEKSLSVAEWWGVKRGGGPDGCLPLQPVTSSPPHQRREQPLPIQLTSPKFCKLLWMIILHHSCEVYRKNWGLFIHRWIIRTMLLCSLCFHPHFPPRWRYIGHCVAITDESIRSQIFSVRSQKEPCASGEGGGVSARQQI